MGHLIFSSFQAVGLLDVLKDVGGSLLTPALGSQALDSLGLAAMYPDLLVEDVRGSSVLLFRRRKKSENCPDEHPKPSFCSVQKIVISRYLSSVAEFVYDVVHLYHCICLCNFFTFSFFSPLTYFSRMIKVTKMAEPMTMVATAL